MSSVVDTLSTVNSQKEPSAPCSCSAVLRQHETLTLRSKAENDTDRQRFDSALVTSDSSALARDGYRNTPVRFPAVYPTRRLITGCMLSVVSVRSSSSHPTHPYHVPSPCHRIHPAFDVVLGESSRRQLGPSLIPSQIEIRFSAYAKDLLANLVDFVKVRSASLSCYTFHLSSPRRTNAFPPNTSIMPRSPNIPSRNDGRPSCPSWRTSRKRQKPVVCGTCS